MILEILACAPSIDGAASNADVDKETGDVCEGFRIREKEERTGEV
jgi:hypothetical protein